MFYLVFMTTIFVNQAFINYTGTPLHAWWAKCFVFVGVDRGRGRVGREGSLGRGGEDDRLSNNCMYVIITLPLNIIANKIKLF